MAEELVLTHEQKETQEDFPPLIIPDELKQDLRKGITDFEHALATHQPDLVVVLGRGGTIVAHALDRSDSQPFIDIDIDQTLSERFVQEKHIDLNLMVSTLKEYDAYYLWLEELAKGGDPIVKAKVEEVAEKIRNHDSLLATLKAKSQESLPIEVLLLDDQTFSGTTLGITTPWIVEKAFEELGIQRKTNYAKAFLEHMNNLKNVHINYNVGKLQLGDLTIRSQVLLSGSPWVNDIVQANFGNVVPDDDLTDEELEELDDADRKNVRDLLVHAVRGGMKTEDGLISTKDWDGVMQVGEIVAKRQQKLLREAYGEEYVIENPAVILTDYYTRAEIMSLPERVVEAFKKMREERKRVAAY